MRLVKRGTGGCFQTRFGSGRRLSEKGAFLFATEHAQGSHRRNAEDGGLRFVSGDLQKSARLV